VTFGVCCGGPDIWARAVDTARVEASRQERSGDRFMREEGREHVPRQWSRRTGAATVPEQG
jgi:hypothetical protein